MNPLLKHLQPYPFERLRQLNQGIKPNPDLAAIHLSIGEPRHASPKIVCDTLSQSLEGLSLYPSTQGLPALREAIANWLTWRFQIEPGLLTPEQHILPVNGSREALFASIQALLDPSEHGLVLMPNPFYQIYEGAAILAGAEPWYLPCDDEQPYPDYRTVPANIWQRTRAVFICNPANPSGAVTPQATLRELIELSQRHQFIVLSDECYSEIYPDEDSPPAGLLQVAAEMGLSDFSRLLAFHSLSKRSNLPGLRSGFVAGDARLIKDFLLYRTYHGSAMPVPTQLASIRAWGDETHVRDNRTLYRQKFQSVLEILQPVWPQKAPDASFYLWARTPIADTEFAQKLWQEQHVQVLPGSYLGRNVNGSNPGEQRVRIALVPDLATCEEAARRLVTFFNQHSGEF